MAQGENHRVINISLMYIWIDYWQCLLASKIEKNYIWHALVAWAISAAMATLDEMPSEKATSSHL